MLFFFLAKNLVQVSALRPQVVKVKPAETWSSLSQTLGKHRQIQATQVKRKISSQSGLSPELGISFTTILIYRPVGQGLS